MHEHIQPKSNEISTILNPGILNFLSSHRRLRKLSYTMKHEFGRIKLSLEPGDNNLNYKNLFMTFDFDENF